MKKVLLSCHLALCLMCTGCSSILFVVSEGAFFFVDHESSSSSASPLCDCSCPPCLSPSLPLCLLFTLLPFLNVQPALNCSAIAVDWWRTLTDCSSILYSRAVALYSIYAIRRWTSRDQRHVDQVLPRQAGGKENIHVPVHVHRKRKQETTKVGTTTSARIPLSLSAD